MVYEDLGYKVEYINYINYYTHISRDSEYTVVSSKAEGSGNNATHEDWLAVKDDGNSKRFRTERELAKFLGNDNNIADLGYELSKSATEWHFDSRGIVIHIYKDYYENTDYYAMTDFNAQGDTYVEFDTYEDLEDYVNSYYM